MRLPRYLINVGATAGCFLLILLAVTANGQTISWSEDWESDSVQADWYAENGIWEMGVPTSGPAPGPLGWRAHQGTNCAATVLAGNYPDDRQSRLVYGGPQGLGLVVPAAELNPRLRFWHWWSFGGGDFGQVQISTNNGVSWQAISPKYGQDNAASNYDSSSRWTRAWLELAPYAGRTVLLGFYFESHSAYAGAGWYVDELTIETGPRAPAVFPEGFEDAAASDRWIANYGVWEIGTPTSGPGGAHSGSGCLATILSGNYTDDRNSRMVSAEFQVPAAELNPRLRFWHWWSFGGGDFGQVQISTNNGIAWETISGTISASSGSWTYAAPINLAAFGGQRVRLGFYFESHSAYAGAGWYIDDLTLLAAYYPPMIIAHPTNQTVVVGASDVTFQVAVSDLSSSPLSYQWRWNGLPILEATNAAYIIDRVQESHAGAYDVVVSNSYGSVTSGPPAAVLHVLSPPAIVQQPRSQTVPAGTDVTFTVQASGTAPLNYQWLSGAQEIPGATSEALTLSNVQVGQSGTAFSVVVRNEAGSVTSEPAWLTVEASDNVWTNHDVGDVSVAGGYTLSEGAFTVWGNGEDIEDTADAFHFVHQPMVGDGQIVARLLSVESIVPRAEAGLMIRQGLEAGSRHVFMAAGSDRQPVLRRRWQQDVASVQNLSPGTNYHWLRLMRLGNTFIGHASTNGTDWDYVWFTTVEMPRQVEVGLAVTARNCGLVATGRFDNVTLRLSELPWPEEEVRPRIYLGGEPEAYPALERLGGFKMLLTGKPGDHYTVRATSDLLAPSASWEVLGTLTNRWGAVDFLDSEALSQPLRFYRFDLQP